MKIIQKIFFLILLVFFLIFLCFIIIARVPAFTSIITDYINSEIYKATGKNIIINRIEFGLIDNIKIKNILVPLKRISRDGEFATIKEIDLRFNILDIIKNKKEINKALSKIIIKSPVFYIYKQNNRLNIEDFFYSFVKKEKKEGQNNILFPLPFFRIIIENGRLIYGDKDIKYFDSLENINGDIFLDIEKKVIKANFDAKSKEKGKGKILVAGDYYWEKNKLKANLKTESLNLYSLINYFVDSKEQSVKMTDITSDINIFFSEKIENLKLNGYVKINDGIILKNNIPINNIKGEFTVTNEKILINYFNFNIFKNPAYIKGYLKDVFKKFEFNFDLIINDFDIVKVAENFLNGKGRITLNIFGDKANIEGRGQLFLDSAEVNKIPIKNIEADIKIKKGIFSLDGMKGKIAEGNLNGNFYVDTKNKNALNGKINLNRLEFEKLTNTKDSYGKINIVSNISGKLDLPYIKVQINSDSIKYKEYSLKNIKGNIIYDKKNLEIFSYFDYSDYIALKLYGNILFNKDRIDIVNLSIKEKASVISRTSGFFNLHDKEIKLDTEFLNIILTKLKIEYFKNKKVEAEFNGKFVLTGKIDSPVVELKLITKKLLIREEPYNLIMDVIYEKNAISIKELNFSDIVTGTAEFSLKKKLFDIKIDIKNLKGDVLKEVLGFDILADSKVNGAAQINKTFDGYNGSIFIDTSYKAGIYKKFEIDISGDKNIFNINKFKIKQKEGFLNITGNFNIKEDSYIFLDINGKAKNYQINDKLKVQFDLENKSKVTLSDKISSSNNLKFTDIKFNGSQLKDLLINLKTENIDITSLKLNWGENYSIRGNLYSDISKIYLRFDFKEADFFPFYAILNMREKGLPKDALLNGYLEISGPLDNSDLLLYISQIKGIARINGKVNFNKNLSVFKLNRLNLDYNILNCDLKNFISIFVEKFENTGSLNSKGKIKGNPENLSSEGNIILSGGVLQGFNYENVNIDYNFNDNKLLFSKFNFYYKNQFLDLSNSFLKIKNKNEFYSDVKMFLKDFVFRGNKLNGNLNFSGAISKYNDFKINGSISSDNFTFCRHTFAPFIININLANDELLLKTSESIKENKLYGNIKFFKNKVFVKEFSIENLSHKFISAQGFITSGDENSDFTIEMVDYDPQVISNLLNWTHEWRGYLNGNIKISRNTKKGLAFTIYLKLTNGSFNNLEFDLFTGLFSLKDNWLDIAPAGPTILTKEGKYEIKATGKIPVPMSEEGVQIVKGVEMDITAQVREGDLSIIKFIKWVDTAEGRLDADIKIKGTKEFPSISGKVNVTDGSASFKYLLKDIKHIFANILIKDNVIDIYSLKGDCGKGILKISNLNDEKKGGLLKEYKIYEANWKIENIGDKIKISDTKYMEFLNGDADLNLEMTGQIENPLIKGEIKLSNTKYTYPTKIMSDKGEEVKDLKNNYAKQITWDVNVYCKENFMYYSIYGNNYAEVFIRPSDSPITFMGKGNDLKITGNGLIQRGTFKYMNTDFSFDEMKESKVVFDSDRRPVLDINAKSKIKRIKLNEYDEEKDVDVYLKAYGRVGDVRIDVSSEPSLDRNRIFYILTFGSDVPKGIDLTQVGKDATMLAADALANYWLKIGGQEIKKRTPLDYVDIKLKASDFLGREDKGQSKQDLPSKTTETADTGGNTPSAIVQIGMGKYLTDQIYFGYDLKLFKHGINLNLNQPGEVYDLQHILGLEYFLDNTKKLKFYRTFGSPNLGLQDETFFGLESRISFESWDSKNKEK